MGSKKMFGMSQFEVSWALHYHPGSVYLCHDKYVFTAGQTIIYVTKHGDFPNNSLQHILTNPKCTDVLLDMESPVRTQAKSSILSCCLDDVISVEIPVQEPEGFHSKQGTKNISGVLCDGGKR